jgi:signal peptidase
MTKEQRKIILEKLGELISTAILICSIILMLFIGLQRLNGIHHPKIFGLRFGMVMSGSMEPNIHVGDLIIIIEPDDLVVNDVVVYIDNHNRSITHRVIDTSDEHLLTKGDANNTPDRAIDYDQVVGEVACRIPIYIYLGVFVVILLTMLIVALIPEKGSREITGKVKIDEEDK